MYGSRGAGSSRSSDDLHNEDAFLVADDIGLYVVCDGRGDTPGGEVAAFIAVDAISNYLEGLLRIEAEGEGKDRPASFRLAAEVSCRTIEGAIRFALESIVEAVANRPDLEGMESTATVLLLQRGRAFVGHVGDSRAYLVRREKLVQLTTDHEWTASESARDARGRGGIDTFSVETRFGDTFILCTDGAEEEIANADLLDAMDEYSPRLIASRLVAAAHRHRPEEDATVVVVRIREDHEFAYAGAPDPPDRGHRDRAQTHGGAYARATLPLSPYDRLFDRSRVVSAMRSAARTDA